MRYKELLNARKIWYKSIGKVYCPILKENVVFNSKGFHHLVFPGGKMRSIREIMYKLGILPLAIPVLKNASKILKYEKIFIKDLGKEVEFWNLQEVVGTRFTLVTVTLRKIGTGNITFFSIKKKEDKKLNCTIKKTPQGKRWLF